MSRTKNKDWSPIYEKILAELGRGEKNATPARKIAEAIGLQIKSPDRSIQCAIRRLVEDGVPIGACVKGFYLITSRKELNDNVSALTGRINGLSKRMLQLRRAFEMSGKV